VTPEDRNFLKEFYGNLREEPLDRTDPRYVPLWENEGLIGSDPVDLMLRSILWTPVESVQLFAGFRGAGKTTELRRLKIQLEDKGYLVVLCDVEDYLNMSTPIDVSDFLIALAGAFGEAVEHDDFLGKNVLREGYWSRFWNFLQTKVKVEELSAEAGGVGVKANLKSDPTFRQRIQEWMAGHLGALVADVRQFFAECILLLKKKYGEEREVVLLVDSVEHMRGTSVNAEAVQNAVERLFTSHAEQLHLPSLHVVYTIHPYLKVRYANLGALYEPGGVKVLPSVKVRSKETGEAVPAAIAALRGVVDKRGDWQKLLGSDALLERVILASGGHLRDLIRLLREVVLRAKSLPVSGEIVSAAMNQIRNESLPIADADAVCCRRLPRRILLLCRPTTSWRTLRAFSIHTSCSATGTATSGTTCIHCSAMRSPSRSSNSLDCRRRSSDGRSRPPC
jgi:hypothetical protein